METNKNYFLVGLFVIATFLAALGFTLWLTAAGKGPTVNYRIYFAESVSGLKVGGLVRFHGVDVGNVKKMIIDPTNIERVQVDIAVLKTTPVKSNTTATLKFQGISGDMYVELSGGNPQLPDLADAAESSEPPEIRSEESGINAVMDRLPKLLEKANHIADQINKILSDKNIETVNRVIAKMASYFGVAVSGKQTDQDAYAKQPYHK